MQVYLSLGSNRGNRKKNLEKAISLLHERGCYINKISSFYETEPFEMNDEIYFYNIIVECRYSDEPHELLKLCEAIEYDMGRRSKNVNSPRKIDIDIIFFGETIVKSRNLIIPHPRFFERNFVLVPMSELMPNFRCPAKGKKISKILSESSDKSEVKKIGKIRVTLDN